MYVLITIDRSKIIDDMKLEVKGKQHSLAYFYCNYNEQERKDPASILRSLVKQLCLQSPKSTLPTPVLSIYHQRKDDADLYNLLSIEECKNLLVHLSAGFLRTTIIIDALDECDIETREGLFDLLEDVVSTSNRNPVKAFITSRDDGDLRKKFEDSPNVYIQEGDNSGDINHYIRAEIEVCIKKKRLLDGKVNVCLKAQIVSALEEGARGMYVSPTR